MPEYLCDHCGNAVEGLDTRVEFEDGYACPSCAESLHVCICGTRTFNRRARCEECRATSGTSPVTGQPHPALNNIVRLAGVEIEFIPGESGGDLDLRDYGVLKGDGSVYDDEAGDGLEFASRPASGSAFVNLVTSVTRTLRRDGAFVNNTCGLHLHLDMGGTSETQRENIQSWWRIYEPIFFGLVEGSRRANEFCDWVGNKPAREWRSQRYHSLNIAAFHEHSTYELRLHHGTLSGTEILGFTATALSFFNWAEQAPPDPAIVEAIRADTSRKFTKRFLSSIKTPYTINKSIIKALRDRRPVLLRDDTEAI